MSVRVYIYKDIDERIEELSRIVGVSKVQIIEVAVNDYYRRLMKRQKGGEK